MIVIPERIHLANLPTKIEKLSRLTEALGGPSIYIKRDDQTGTELSGNKVRKLEYSLKEALDQGHDSVITCGGVQSNHARATAAAAAKLGLRSFLVLRGSEEAENDGNLLLARLLGAEVKFITAEEYSNHRHEIMMKLKEEQEKLGFKPYLIPEGASNGIGAFGYYTAMEEIIQQEQEMGIHFDGIVVPVGSGGTYAGLFLAARLQQHPAQIIGFNVCDDADYFRRAIDHILGESASYLGVGLPDSSREEYHIVDGYVGEGYAQSRPEETAFIHELAKLEGVVLDPVYGGKAMYGLTEEIRKGSFKHLKHILFIHTGGLFGVFPGKQQFNLSIKK